MTKNMTRDSVSVKSRYNVRQSFFWRAIDSLMDGKWYERFVEAIQNDPRDMKAISQAAKCGPNYVQQMIAYKKRPTVDKFLAILGVLGNDKLYTVITGIELGPEDSEFIRVASNLSPAAKASAVEFFRNVQASEDTQEPSVLSPD